MFASDYREKAREALRGKWKRMALMLLLATLLGAGGGLSVSGILDVSSNLNLNGAANAQLRRMLTVLSGIAVFSSLWALFMGSWVNVGLFGLGCRVLDGEQPRAGMLFPKGVYAKCVGMSILRSLIVFAWSLLLVVPGIIAAYRYAMADYILAKHPEMGVMEALNASKECMQGRKGRLFCLQFSFIGWMLLTEVPIYVVLLLATPILTVLGRNAGLTAVIVLMALCVLAMMVASLFLNAYMHMASVIFFRNAERPQEWQQQAQQGWSESQEWYGGESAAESGTEGAAVEDSGYRVTSLTADETVAKDVFMQHGCSRKRMRDEGVLEEYEALRVDSSFELRWLREYANALMLRFSREPETLDEILDLASEYAMDDLLTRALERIDRHIRQQSLPDVEILNMAGRVLALVVSGTFDEHPDFMRRRREQVSDMADRLEVRLREQNPDGDWQRTLQLVRQMCSQV
ncbi:MAG: DUF975 family protein [Clostridia bacterium]|nr:DUF975 family protein [Clostridia bacterium]